ncbi:DUF6531 domain-containing protein, partial [Dyella jejuensis]
MDQILLVSQCSRIDFSRFVHGLAIVASLFLLSFFAVVPSAANAQLSLPPTSYPATPSGALALCNATRAATAGQTWARWVVTPCMLANCYTRSPVSSYTSSDMLTYGFYQYYYLGVLNGFSISLCFNASEIISPINSGDNSVCSCGGGNGGIGPVMIGDPVNSSTGNKYEQDDDYVDNDWLAFRRFYNSVPSISGASIGVNWRHSFDRSLYIVGNPATIITLIRPSGQQEVFTENNGVWVTSPYSADTLSALTDTQGNVTGYKVYISASRHIETYDALGQLLSVSDLVGNGITLTYSAQLPNASLTPTEQLATVTDAHGRSLVFTYNSQGLVSQVTLPDGSALTYSYDGDENLTSVTYPDGKIRQYVYNESSLTSGSAFFNAMTGVIDESGERFESTIYDSAGRAISTYMAGNVGASHIAYNTNGSASVTYPLGFTSTMTFSTVQGVNKVASLDQPCGPQCNQPWKSITYDANGNPQTSTDFNGITTATTYNSANLLTQQIDAQGTASQRTTNFTWNTTLRVPLTRSVLDASGNPVSTTQWAYNATGQTLARCDIDPTNSAAAGYSCSASGSAPSGVRRTTYTYCTTVDTVQCPLPGLLLAVTGPRTDLSSTA